MHVFATLCSVKDPVGSIHSVPLKIKSDATAPKTVPGGKNTAGLR